VPRSARSRLGVLVALLVALGVGASVASAASTVDPTKAVLSCSPASLTAGSATHCTVTIADAAATSSSVPTGVVTFSASPSTGSFSDSGRCALARDGSARASCTVAFIPAAGGSYTLTAAYAGDSAHSPNIAEATLSAADRTLTSLTCSPSRLSVNTTSTCTATITDTGSPQAPVGQVTFSSNRRSGSFGDPGQCEWAPASSGKGGTATCPVTYTPTAAGSYTLTASYGGDSVHGASADTTNLTVKKALTGGGPGSSGPPGVTLPVGPPGPKRPPPGAGRIAFAARTAAVSVRHIAGVRLACLGSRRATCAGVLTLTTRIRVKVRTRLGRRTRTRTEIDVVTLGSVVYKVHARAKKSVSVVLSRRAMALLRKARRHRLRVSASATGVVRTVVLVPALRRRARRPRATHPRASARAR
jgi:hypothetical protein